MHMADALLSPAVGATMWAISTVSNGYGIKKITDSQLSEKKLPVMAVSGAFVFAAQMINFTIPGTGSSGHIGGGILLAMLLGEFPALLTISSVLLIQCLMFADGDVYKRQDLGKRVPRVYLKDGKVVGTKDYFDDTYNINL